MRVPACLMALLMGSLAQAQTATSVQDGDWIDPATWDCGCIPVLNDAVVMHTVQITTNWMFSMQELHITASGMLTMDAPHSVNMTEAVINDGSMHILGEIDSDGQLYNNGLIHVEGDFLTHGLLVMGGPGTLLTTVNMENGGTIDGTGLICVSEFSASYGTIQGQIDFCDGTPTTTTPPFIDYNTGVVASTVTFCLDGSCTTDVQEHDALERINVWPVPASHSITLDELPSSACSIELREATGRLVHLSFIHEGSRATIDVGHLQPGIYHLVVSTGMARRSMPIAIMR